MTGIKPRKTLLECLTHIEDAVIENTATEQMLGEAYRLRRLANAAPDLLTACEIQHRAIDHLFTRLLNLVEGFRPSESGLPWEAVVTGHAAMKKAIGS